MKQLLQNIRKNKNWRRLGKMRTVCKSIFWFVIKAITYNRGIKMNIGGLGNLRLDSQFMFSSYESWGKNHNDGFLQLVDICRNKKTVLDIGAHIGLCALPVSKVIASDGLVYAFEPSKTNFDYLTRHISYNKIKNIKPFSLLVGEQDQDNVEFYEAKEATGMNSIIRYKTLDSAIWRPKKQVSLDSFCEKENIRPEVIKIDVEGAELAVLRGAQNIIKKYQPTIILSVHPRHLAILGEKEEDILSMMQELNYNLCDMDGSPVTHFELKEYILTPQKQSATLA